VQECTHNTLSWLSPQAFTAYAAYVDRRACYSVAHGLGIMLMCHELRVSATFPLPCSHDRHEGEIRQGKARLLSTS
jgi:hypothetical protein